MATGRCGCLESGREVAEGVGSIGDGFEQMRRDREGLSNPARLRRGMRCVAVRRSTRWVVELAGTRT
jgi:hypothetical protein